jgi:capsular exopolysaccharide synthesis family protein
MEGHFLKWKKASRRHLITHTHPRSSATEAYRTLRTNIQFAALDKPVHTLLITGSTPKCGKTTTSANLAVTIAQAGSSVLLVDCDLRRPMLHQYFGLSNVQGITNLLVDVTMDLGKVVCKTNVENLDLLASGPLPPNPSEILATERMKNMIGVFSSAYDYVIFDSPPVIAVTDAAILSRLVDATILVLDYGVVSRAEAAYALEQLRKVQANVIGTVINGLPGKKSQYYYYQNYYGSGKTKYKKEKAFAGSRKGWVYSDLAVFKWLLPCGSKLVFGQQIRV